MKDNLNKAEVHIRAAIRRLEQMLWFVQQGKKLKLSLDKHLPAYFELITTDLAGIQSALYTDDEYTESVAQGLARVNDQREYSYNVTTNRKGDKFYVLDATLPLKEMKKNVIFVRRNV